LNNQTVLTKDVVVIDAPLSGTAGSVVSAAGSPFLGVVASFTDAAPNSDPAEYQATIDWGDGHISNGIVTADGNGGLNVAARNTYTQVRSYGIQTTIRDVGGATTTVPPTADIWTIKTVEGAPFSGVVGSFTSSVPGAQATDFAATIDWGDGQTSTAII